MVCVKHVLKSVHVPEKTIEESQKTKIVSHVAMSFFQEFFPCLSLVT